MERASSNHNNDESEGGLNGNNSSLDDEAIVNRGWRDTFYTFSGDEVTAMSQADVLKPTELSVDRDRRSLILGSFVSGLTAITRPHEIPGIIRDGMAVLRRIVRDD